MTNSNNPTPYAIRQLRQEAAAAGDAVMVSVCTMALGGTPYHPLPNETQESCLTACRLMIEAAE